VCSHPPDLIEQTASVEPTLVKHKIAVVLHHFSFPVTALIHVSPNGVPGAHDAIAHHER